MKRVLSFIVQLILMLIAFFAGSIAPVFRVLPLWRVATGPGHWFVLDGLIVLLVLYVLLLLFSLLRRNLMRGSIVTTAAFALALVLGLLSRFPFTGT